MKLLTKNFGEVEISEDKILNFPQGLIAFQDFKRFSLILNTDKDNPLHWLQCIDKPEVSFVVINPFLFQKDYEFDISPEDKRVLEIEDEKDVAVFSIVVVPESIKDITANLLAPVVININKKKGKQVVLQDKRYTTRHYIFKEDDKNRGGK